jgi:putative ABC transport system ATP-binding protein
MSFLETLKVGRCFRAGTDAELWAVHEVSLAIPQGSFVALTGPSGSGKTTLLGLLGGLDNPSRGHVLFEGIDLGGCSDVQLTRVRRQVGFVFQNVSLIPRLPLWENVTYHLIPRGASRAERSEIARALLYRFGMAEKLDKAAGELSAGEQQRAAIARALAGRPRVILADEPTSNLDQSARRILSALFQEFRACGNTVVVCTHDIELVSQATLVCELERGRLKT